MSKRFSLDFQVRDYELDQYGVVNNAVYLNYLEHTRHEFLIAVGLDAAGVARQGRALALSELQVRFLRPLGSRERFRVGLLLERLTGARAVFRQEIARLADDAPVLEALATAVWLDGRGRPHRIPPPVREALAPYLVPAR